MLGIVLPRVKVSLPSFHVVIHLAIALALQIHLNVDQRLHILVNVASGGVKLDALSLQLLDEQGAELGHIGFHQYPLPAEKVAFVYDLARHENGIILIGTSGVGIDMYVFQMLSSYPRQRLSRLYSTNF